MCMKYIYANNYDLHDIVPDIAVEDTVGGRVCDHQCSDRFGILLYLWSTKHTVDLRDRVGYKVKVHKLPKKMHRYQKI